MADIIYTFSQNCVPSNCFLLMFHTGTLWMNWCMVGICAGCIPLLLLFKEQYSRLELDAVNRHAKRVTVQNEGLGEETPLVSSSDRGYGGDDSGVRNRTESSSHSEV